MSPKVSYLDFLSALLALGPKLQAVWPKIQAAILAVSELVKAGRELFPGSAPKPADPPVGEPGTLSMHAPVDEDAVADAEAKVAALIAGETAMFDPSIFRALWGALSQHPAAVMAIGQLLDALFHGE